MKIAVVGMGYVGTSLAVLLSSRHSVHALDVDAEKIAQLQAGVSPIADRGTEEVLAQGSLDIHPTCDAHTAFEDAQLVIVAVPTDYDLETHFFNTSIVEDVVAQAQEINPRATIVIKSTIPVGFTQQLAERYPQARILFSPEFLREGHALEDNMYPSRIVVGLPLLPDARAQAQLETEARRFANLLVERAQDKTVPVLIMGSSEAEASKLFANTYLATRVAFFNELDTYALVRGLNTEQLIEAVCADPRIGKGYNNPSFGYGGYCLPKDTKQLLANFEDVPQRLIAAVIEANQTRKDAMVSAIVARLEDGDNVASCAEDGDNVASLVARDMLDNATSEDCSDCGGSEPLVGVYRLGMKAESDNMRSSSVLDIVAGLLARGLSVLVYEPAVPEVVEPGYEVTHDLDAFLERSTLVVANRLHEDIAGVADKVFSRDLFLDD